MKILADVSVNAARIIGLNRLSAGVREAEAQVVASAHQYDQVRDQTLRAIKGAGLGCSEDGHPCRNQASRGILNLFLGPNGLVPPQTKRVVLCQPRAQAGSAAGALGRAIARRFKPHRGALTDVCEPHPPWADIVRPVGPGRRQALGVPRYKSRPEQGFAQFRQTGDVWLMPELRRLVPAYF